MYFEFYLSALPSSFHGNPRAVTWVCWEIRHRQPLASTFRLQAVNSTLPEPLPPAAHPRQRRGELGLGVGVLGGNYPCLSVPSGTKETFGNINMQ